MRNAAKGRSHVKSRLLVGAAGMVATALSGGAYAADATADATPTPPPAPPPTTTSPSIPPQKWLPYADIGGGVGSGFAVGRIDTFTPVWQNLDSLFFVRVGADTRTNYSENFNLGFGYRTKIDDDWILGGFAGFDSSQTEYGHTFSQFSFGAEAMSADWDLRINGYGAQQHENRAIDGHYTLYTQGTEIAILQAQEAALSGIDGEIGYRVFSTDTTDVRLFAGGFTFHHEDAKSESGGRSFDFNYHDVSGPKARAEVNIFDLDMLGPQSRLSIDGEVSHDDVHHTSEYIGATLRIPLNDVSGGGAQALGDLDRRMVDPVRRNDNVLTQYQFNKPEPVIIYNGSVRSQPTNTVYYAEQRSGTGAGTYTDPTTIQDAASRGPKNQFVVLTSQGGAKIDAAGTVVQSGDTIVGGGPTPFKIRGVDSGTVFAHEFAPNSSPVTLTGNATSNVLNLGAITALYGFGISGPFKSAIYGQNVSDLHIEGVTIDGDGTGTNGIAIKQDTAGTAAITIDNVSITGVTGDGVQLDVAESGAGTSSVSLNITDASIDAALHGVNVMSSALNTAQVAVYAGIHDSTITSAGTAISMTGTSGADSTLSQKLVVDPTVLTGGKYGIFVDAYASGGILDQSIDISDVTVKGASVAGVYVDAHAVHSGTINQNATMDGITVQGSTHTVNETVYYDGHPYTISYVAGTDGIEIRANAESKGVIKQIAALSDVSVSDGLHGVDFFAEGKNDGAINQGISLTNAKFTDSYYDGIVAINYAEYSSTVHQTLALTNVASTGAAFGEGLFVVENAFDGSTAIQHIDIDGLTATGNAFNGATFISGAENDPTGSSGVAALYVTIAHSNISDNGENGVEAEVYGVYASVARQDISITNTKLNGNRVAGFDAYAGAFQSGAAQQNIYLAHVTADDNGYSGVTFSSTASFGGFVEQDITVYASSFDHNGGFGVFTAGEAYGGGDVEQNIGLYDVTADSNKLGGAYLATTSVGYDFGKYIYYSHVQHNVTIEYSTFSNNGGSGIAVDNYVGYGGRTDEILFLYGVAANHNKESGFSETTIDNSSAPSGTYAIPTNITSDVYLYKSEFGHNGANGITIAANAYGPLTIPTSFYGYSYLTQHVLINGVTANNNAGNGLDVEAHEAGVYALNEQYVTVSGSTFAHNTGNGATFVSQAYYGPGSFGASIQHVTIDSSHFDQNGRNGLYALADAYGRQGRAEQNFSIDGSTFDANTGNGIELYRKAHNGEYLTGFPCTGVQGVDGGCAFVRQEVSIANSQADGNGGDGILVSTYVNHYGAVYDASGRPHAPTLYLLDTDVSGNGANGLDLENIVSGASYLFQYAVAVDSKFDGNGLNGIFSNSYVGSGSVMLQNAILYSYKTGTTASGNGHDGAYFVTEAVGAGSYALTSLTAFGINASDNKGSGTFSGGIVLENLSFGSAGTYSVGKLKAYEDTLTHESAGIVGITYGPVAVQYNAAGYNTISHTTNGIVGYAGFDSYQFWDLHYKNTMSHNGANYDFFSYGAYQHVTY